jgi:hypothetical protein
MERAAKPVAPQRHGTPVQPELAPHKKPGSKKEYAIGKNNGFQLLKHFIFTFLMLALNFSIGLYRGFG